MGKLHVDILEYSPSSDWMECLWLFLGFLESTDEPSLHLPSLKFVTYDFF